MPDNARKAVEMAARDRPAWSCEDGPGRDGNCRNAYGCHCREITIQRKRITELEAACAALQTSATRPAADPDGQSEADRIDYETKVLIGDREAIRRAVLNAYRMARLQYSRKPLWSFAMELFGCGSTYGFTICDKLGLDPDACGRAALTSPARARGEG